MDHHSLTVFDNFTWPTLPRITDDKLRHAASRVAAPDYDSDEDDSAYVWEKLTPVGEALLGAFVACLLHEQDPDKGMFAAFQHRLALLSPDILSAISHHYKLPNFAVVKTADERRVRESKKKAAQLFEGYIGALFSSYRNEGQLTQGQAVDKVSLFLKPRFAPLASLPRDMLDPKEVRRRLEQVARGYGDELCDLLESSNVATAGLPDREHYRLPDLYGSGYQGSLFECRITVKLRDGTLLEGRDIADSKIDAEDVAAYKVWQQIKRYLSL